MIQLRERGPGDGSEPGARFRPGQIVFHKRYRYRGVVVDSDPECRAEESWYQANLTQPKKSQPWYHVLPHATGHAKYVAEENLMPDPTGEPIVHPLVAVYFSGFEDGHYARNDVPWRG